VAYLEDGGSYIRPPKMIVTFHNPVTAILVEGLWQTNVYHFKKCNFCVKIVDIKLRYYNYYLTVFVLHVLLSSYVYLFISFVFVVPYVYSLYYVCIAVLL